MRMVRNLSILGAASLVAAGCTAESDPEAAPAGGASSVSSAALEQSVSSSPGPSEGGGKSTRHVDGPTYGGLDAALADASVVVKGTVTRRLGVAEQVEPGADPSQEHASMQWATFALEIEDPLGVSGAKVVTLVDFDREAATVEDEGVAVSPGLTGYWALNTADRQNDPVLDDAGYTYFPVYFVASEDLPLAERDSPNMADADEPVDETVLKKHNQGKSLRAPHQ